MNAKYIAGVVLIVVVFTAGALLGDVLRSPAMAQEGTTGDAPVASTDNQQDAKPETPASGNAKPIDEKQDGTKPSDITAVLKPAPVVTAFPYRSETEYEMDPFDETRIRSTKTIVKNICIVRADGKTEIVEAK